MTKQPKSESRRITVAGAQFWRCPFCFRDNGIPERADCDCGAVLSGDGRVSRASEAEARGEVEDAGPSAE